MVVHDSLLSKVTDAGARLAEADRQALLARADYHTAVRRLHLAGGSVREIAEALSISHQRVQQIVNAAGGSWWQIWKRRRVRPDAVCTWCGRPPSEVSKLIAGPAVFICDDCTQAAEDTVSGAGGRSDLRVEPQTGRARCSFCRKRAADHRTLVVGQANVCSECLKTCREILDSRVA